MIASGSWVIFLLLHCLLSLSMVNKDDVLEQKSIQKLFSTFSKKVLDSSGLGA